MNKVGSYFRTDKFRLKIEKKLGKGKSGYSYLAYNSDVPVVLKVMHDEPCPYYNFEKDKTTSEEQAYNILKNSGIKVPELIHYNVEKHYLVKEYIDGYTAAEWISQGKIDNHIISQLFKMAKRVKRKNLNIDFFPTNFVIQEKVIYYIDYEVNPYDEKWSLENWGLFYWANADGFATFLKTGDASAINSNVESGIPIKEAFQDQVDQWIKKYLH